MEDLARTFGDWANEKRYADMASGAKHSFNSLFWNEETGCLYDVVDKDARDGSIRPNQILAVSLFYTMLSQERGKGLLRL
jgi:predicted glycogen debranching enzyme